MDQQRSATIHFFGGIKPLTVHGNCDLVVEDVLMKCLLHVSQECRDKSQLASKEDEDLSSNDKLAMVLPAFGLARLPEETIWLPPWEKFNIEREQEFKLRVRFRPPVVEFKQNKFLSNYLCVQLFQDFLDNWHGLANHCIENQRQLRAVLSFVIYLPRTLPLEDDLIIDKSYKKANLNFLNFKKKSGVCPQMYDKMTSESMFDKIHICNFLNDAFKKYMSKGYRLSSILEKLYSVIVGTDPKYCFEVYQCISEEVPDNIVPNNQTVSAHLKLYHEGRARDSEPGFYYDEQFIMELNDIEKISLKHPVDQDKQEWRVIISGRRHGPLKPVNLVFNGKAVAESFISMVQGYRRLFVQYSMAMVNQMEDMTSEKLCKKLASFGPLESEEAQSLLEEKSDEDTGYLIHQSPIKHQWYVVVALAAQQAQQGPQETSPVVEMEMEVTENWRFTLHSLGDDQPQVFADIVDLKKDLKRKYGGQLLPRKCAPVNLASINKLYMPELPPDPIECYDITIEASKSYSPLFMLKDLWDSKQKIEDKNRYIRKWSVTIPVEQRWGSESHMMLLELMNNNLIEDFRKGIVDLHKLGRIKPERFLHVFGAILDSPKSMLMELPDSDLLTYVHNHNTRLKTIFEMTYEIADILEVLSKSGIFHGNIHCRKFMVFEESRGIKIKLGDPGIGHYMDTLGEQDDLNIERLPWMKPEKRRDPSLRNYETECYAVGTTFYEMLCKDDRFGDAEHLKRTFLNTDSHLPTPHILTLQDPGQAGYPSPDARQHIQVLWELIQECWEKSPPADELRQRLADLVSESQGLLEETCGEVMEKLKYIEEHAKEKEVTRVPKEKRDKMLVHKARIPFQNLTKMEKIGSGYYANVYKGVVREPSLQMGSPPVERVVAIKELTRAWDQSQEDFFKELDIAVDLKHDNIVRLLYFTFDPKARVSGYNTLVMEFIEHKSLKDYIRDRAKTIRDAQLYKFCRDIIMGMRYLSEKHIVHRDLACRNVLIGGDIMKPIAKVADFGLARRTEANLYLTKMTEKLPSGWMPPEVNESFSTKGDVWSYGVVLWEIFTRGCNPRSEMGHLDDVLKSLRDGFRLPQSTFNKSLKASVTIPSAVYEVMTTKCWLFDPQDRPFFADLEGIMKDLATQIT